MLRSICLLPAAFRAGGYLLHIHPTQGRLGYKESLNPGWKSTHASEDFKKIGPQAKQAAKLVLAHCNHAKPEQNFGWVLSKAPLGNKRFLEYRVGITGVPRGLHPEPRFPKKQLIDVKLEPPFDTFHELYQEGGNLGRGLVLMRGLQGSLGL